MELKEGKMAIKDLSVWFELKPETISKGQKSARELAVRFIIMYQK